MEFRLNFLINDYLEKCFLKNLKWKSFQKGKKIVEKFKMKKETFVCLNKNNQFIYFF